MKMVRFFRSKKSPKTRPKYKVEFDPGVDIRRLKKMILISYIKQFYNLLTIYMMLN